MYDKFYGFSGRPFQLNPDPRFFYRSKGHQRAMAYLRYGLQQRQGFIVVTGDVGTGKTMLVNTLFRELQGKNLVAARIVSTNVEDAELLKLVAAAFELPFEKLSKAALLNQLGKFFTSAHEAGKHALLVIDEAQNLPRNALEELRMLSNFENDGEPLVQSFLLGQREFRATMRTPGLEQLRQRVIAAYHLKPLNAQESKDYIRHRLNTVGWTNDPSMDDEVFERIFAYTRGVPRRINTLADRLLLSACLDEVHAITVQQLESVIDEIELERGDVADEEPLPEPAQPAREQVADRRVAQAAAAAASADLGKIEQRLSAMQHMVDSISRRLEEASHVPRPPLAMQEQMLAGPGIWRSWAVPFGIGVFLLAVVGVAAYMLFAGAGA
jgi:putative secretion ATPase (PEP-CTERM system associated)